MTTAAPGGARIEVVAPPPFVENRDYGYFDSPPQRRLQRRTSSDGHDFSSIVTSRSGDIFVNWRVTLPQAGRYEVSIFIPRRFATTTQARYFVHGIKGRTEPSEHLVNQSLHFDQWVQLGAFDFDPAQNADIFVDAQNASPENPPLEIAYDSIRWRLITDTGTPPRAWVWPVSGQPQRIGHPFNEPRPSFGANKRHEGVDILAPQGSPIVAVAAGTITKVHKWNPSSRRGADAYGNHVVIQNDNSQITVLYAHMSAFAAGLAAGQHVEAGQKLGDAGSTGNSTAAHLHITVTHPTLGLDGYVVPKVLDPAPLLQGATPPTAPNGAQGVTNIPSVPSGGGGAINIEPTGDATVTNQSVVNLLYKIAPNLGFEAFPLMERMGWQNLAIPSQNRNLTFDRARLGQAPGSLSASDWDTVRKAIEALFARPNGVVYAQMPEGHHALAGLHGPADPGDWAWTDNDNRNIRALRTAGVEAVKVLVPEIRGETLLELARSPRIKFILARLFAKMNTRQGATIAERVQAFLDQVDPVAQGNNGPLARAFNAGVRYFEIHNEVNLSDEGMFTNWQNGGEFAQFFVQVAARLRARYRGAKFGFPGLSPGAAIPNQRYPMDKFLTEAASALRDADFLCAHFYWGGDGSDYKIALRDLRQFCERFPDKIIFLSEFSNNQSDLKVAPKNIKSEQYRDFYQAARGLPPNLGAVFAFCLSSTGSFQHEVWVEKSGAFSPIFNRLGLV